MANGNSPFEAARSGAAPMPYAAPPVPETIAGTGIPENLLRSLVLKLMLVHGRHTASEITEELKLPRGIVIQLLEDAKDLALVEILGLKTSDGMTSELRYALTGKGRDWAADALSQSQYVGPTPVPLDEFRAQVERQRLIHEQVTRDDLRRALSGLFFPDHLVDLLGPAANSARSILLYGPPGNGKTSIAEAVGRVFKQPIFVPYCIEVDSSIIKIFDSTVHAVVPLDTVVAGTSDGGADAFGHAFDPRWTPCVRPTVITGGELTLGMLDLVFNPYSKYYEAPMQMKATGGVFVIDDFGRQLVSPHDVLNRWIIPLERGKDYLTLHTGKKFEVPFDELVVFSTNLPPKDLMDAATMRRILYKIEVPPPATDTYKTIFEDVCAARKIPLPADILPFLFAEYYSKDVIPLACYHPRYIVEQVIARCDYEGTAPHLTKELVDDAVHNLYVT